jgi:capsular polysaccharide transport system permease protein
MTSQSAVEGMRIQGRVLLALMLREARTRYGRRQAGYLWALIEPIMHVGMFVIIFTYAARPVPLGQSTVLFLVTGLATYFGFRNVMTRTQGGYGSNEALLSFPIVKVIDCFLGRALLELATWLAVTIILIGALIAVGEANPPRSPVTMLGAIFALAAIGFGVGVCLGIVGEFLPSLSSLLKMPMRFLYFVSGAFFLPDQMPPAARSVLEWNPVLHGITLFRMGYYHLYDSHMFSGRYLWGWAVGSVLLALVVERVARKPLRNLSG